MSKFSKIKILIIHAYTHENKGDCAIVKGAVRTLKHYYPEAHITISSLDATDRGNYEEDAWLPGLHTDFMKHKSKLGFIWSCVHILSVVMIKVFLCLSLGKKARHPFIKGCADAHIVLACGGGYLYGKSPLNFALSITTLAVPLLFSKPLIMCSQTIGPFSKHSIQGGLVRMILRRKQVREIHLREEKSFKLLNYWGLGNKTKLVPDLAWAFGYFYKLDTGYKSVGNKRGTMTGQILGFTVRRWFRNQLQQDLYEATVAEVLEHFAQRGTKLVGMIQVDAAELNDSDVDVTERVIRKLSPSAREKCVSHNPTSPELMLEMLRTTTVFLGTRMHSNILALLANVPVVAIGYQYKTSGIMESLGIGSYVVEIEDVEANTLIELLTEAMKKRTEYLACVDKAISEMGKESAYSLAIAVETAVGFSTFQGVTNG